MTRTASAALEAAIGPGFADPVFDAHRTFRGVLDGLAYAGRVHNLGIALEPPAPLGVATAALALTLCDFDAPLWLDAAAASGEAPAYLRFHCGVPLVEAPRQASFAIIADAASMPSLDAFAIGEDRYPERSATVIVEVPALTGGRPRRCTGPGIDGTIDIAIEGLPERFWGEWRGNHALYPLGVDLVFTAGAALVGLPRGIRVED